MPTVLRLLNALPIAHWTGWQLFDWGALMLSCLAAMVAKRNS